MFRGMFTGMMMTVAGAFAADSMADANARPIVNWDVAIVKSIDVANFVRLHVSRLMDRAQASSSESVGQAPTNGGGTDDKSGASVLDEAPTVLADVVDPSTLDVVSSAQRSGDPGKRSKAAAKTRDAVKAKLDLLRQKRALIEARAKQLRR